MTGALPLQDGVANKYVSHNKNERKLIALFSIQTNDIPKFIGLKCCNVSQLQPLCFKLKQEQFLAYDVSMQRQRETKAQNGKIKCGTKCIKCCYITIKLFLKENRAASHYQQGAFGLGCLRSRVVQGSPAGRSEVLGVFNFVARLSTQVKNKASAFSVRHRKFGCFQLQV